MNNWIHIEDSKPKHGQKVWYFFDVLGVFSGTYSSVNVFPESPDHRSDVFSGDSGCLTDDVTHWMPYQPNKPDRPTIFLDMHFDVYVCNKCITPVEIKNFKLNFEERFEHTVKDGEITEDAEYLFSVSHRYKHVILNRIKRNLEHHYKEYNKLPIVFNS